MTVNNGSLVSGRVPVTDYANLTADRYQFLSVTQAEPNLGPGADNSVLVITTDNTRSWANSLTLTGNVSANYFIGNGSLLTGLATTTITNQTFNGDGSTVAFTLDAVATSVTVLVTINGITQTPDVDYLVIGNILTFMTAPAVADVIQVRSLASAVVPGNYSNANVAGFLPIYSGNLSAGNISVTGNITGTYILGNGSFLTGITATANTGDVTFSNQAVIGTGDQYGGSGLYLAPGTESVGNLQYLRVRGGDYPTHIHLDTGNNQYFDQYFGDDAKYVKLANTGNIVIKTDDFLGNGAQWTFGANGGTIFPTLNVQRGDNPSGTIQGQTLLFGDAGQEAIISTPDGNPTDGINSQRLVINPGQGYGSGEGGDIYLWAGRGGDTDGNGGDVKIRGGQGMGNGPGGYIRMEAGDTQNNGTPGFIEITGGQGGNTTGGYVQITGGVGGNGTGGVVDLYGGYGISGPGAAVNIVGGGSSNGLAEYGNVNIAAGASTWSFKNNGTTQFPNNTINPGEGLLLTLRTQTGNAYTQVEQESNIWVATSGDDATAANPAFATIATNLFTTDEPTVFIQTQKGSDGIVQTWEFNRFGNLTLPDIANASINYANGVSILDGIGGGSSNIIYNGTSNVSIPDSGGNVYINANTSVDNQWVFDTNGYLTMPLVTRLNSGGVGNPNSAEFGTEVTVMLPSQSVTGSQIYMGAGTTEIRGIVDAAGAGLMYAGVEGEGFAGIVGMDPGVTSQYAITVGTGNTILLGATQPGGALTTTEYTAGVGALNANGTINGLLASSSNVVISNGNTAGWSFGADGELTTPQGGRLGSAGKGWQGLDGGWGNPVSFTSLYANGFYAGCLTASPDGNVNISTYTGNGLQGSWTFDNTGNLTTSGNISATGNVTAGNLTTGGIANLYSVRMSQSISWPDYSGSQIYEDGGLVINGPGGVLAQGNIAARFEFNDGLGNSSGLYSDIGNSLVYSVGNVIIRSNNLSQTDWTFDTTGNLSAPGNISAVGNITGGNVLSDGILSVAGDAIIAGNLSVTGNTITVNTEIVNVTESVTGNITAGNVLTGGEISATGNVTGNYFIGNGSQLTGISAGLPLANGTSNFDIATANGNVTITANGSDTWTFDTIGNLTFPSGNLVITPDYAAFSNAAVISSVNNLVTLSTGASGGLSSLWVEDFGNIGTSNIAAVYANPVPGSGNVRIAVGSNGGPGPSLWDFDHTGTLTLPGGSRLRPLGANLDIFAGAGSYVNLITSDESSSVGVAGNGGFITTVGGTWSFGTTGNLSAPGNISAVGNITGSNINALGNITSNAITLKNTDDFAQIVFSSDGGATNNGQIKVDSGTNMVVSAASNFYVKQAGSDRIAVTNTTSDFMASTNVSIQSNKAGSAYTWNFDNTGNLIAPGNISATGNIASGNISVTANVTSGNISTGNIASGNISVTANVTSGNISTGNIASGNITLSGNITGNTAGYAIGYRDIPQLSFTGNTTIATTDAGKHYYSTQSTNYTLTIANNASQGFQVGAAITIVNQGTGNITIAQGSGVTLYLGSNSTPGNRLINSYGLATLIKVGTNTWFISGAGVV